MNILCDLNVSVHQSIQCYWKTATSIHFSIVHGSVDATDSETVWPSHTAQNSYCLTLRGEKRAPTPVKGKRYPNAKF